MDNTGPMPSHFKIQLLWRIALSIVLISFSCEAEAYDVHLPLQSLPTVPEHCRVGKKCRAGNDGDFHTGVDYMVKPGTPVFAICDGVVEFDASKRSNIWDRFLIIKHSSCGQHEVLYGYYGHIDSLVSGVGKRISKGQHIANVKEWPGDIKNTHLHFGISPKWFPKWGYQAGDPLANGWLDPEAFFKEIVTRKPSETPSRDSSKQPSTSPISTLPTGVPSNISRTTLDDFSNRRTINPQQVCEINFPLGSYYYQGSVLGVKHIYESDQIDLVGTHYCEVQYRLDYPGSFMRMFSPSQLFDVNRPRTAREGAVFYNSWKLCYVKYGYSARLVQGKDGTSDHGKIWCEMDR